MERGSSEIEGLTLKDVFKKTSELYSLLLSKWMIILSAGLLGGTIGFTYAYFKKPIFTSITTFVLEDKEGSALGSYAGIASMVGIDLNSGGGGAFQGENLLELYKSRKMITNTLLSRDTFEGKKNLLIDRYIYFKKLKNDWNKKPDLSKINFDIPLKDYTIKHDSIIGVFVADINKDVLSVSRPDKKLSFIRVEVKTEDEQFSKSFAENIVNTVNDFYIRTKTKKSLENLEVLKHQADSVKAVLNQSITGVASAVDANPNQNQAFQLLRVPSQKRQVDVQASAAIYQEIVKNLELAKITFRKEKPLIQVIDQPIYPLKKDKLGKVKSFVIGSVLAGILVSIYLVIRDLLKKALL